MQFTKSGRQFVTRSLGTRESFLTGLEVLLSRHKSWLRHRRLGLLSHPAAITRAGMNAGEAIWRERGLKLCALFGPEHGFWGVATAGEIIRHQRHQVWQIPVYSLYGQQRRPSRAMFQKLDALIVDLQNLAARPYTYIATLRYVMELAADMGKIVIVADRPVPLPHCVDGPMLAPAFESFVGCVPAPMHYGMTPGEAALWLQRSLKLDLDLRVARMQGYARTVFRTGQLPWIPPSPGIRTWETAQVYLATIWGEALPAIHVGQGHNLIFQIFSAPWLKSEAVCKSLNNYALPGVNFYSHPYRHPTTGRLCDGVRLAVHNAHAFQPVFTGVVILKVLQELYGIRRLWQHKNARPRWFDQLYGTDSTRRALVAGESVDVIQNHWRLSWRHFLRERQQCLLYEEENKSCAVD